MFDAKFCNDWLRNCDSMKLFKTMIPELCNSQFCSQNTHGDHKKKKRKESIFDSSKYVEKNIRTKCASGRETADILKGYDPLLCRGTSVVLTCPVDGMESIQNPFIQQDG